jgi:hypothetical protein
MLDDLVLARGHNTPDATTAPAMGAILPQAPKPISTTAMTKMPLAVGNFVDRGSESYQDPSATAARTATCLFAITCHVPENPPVLISSMAAGRPARPGYSSAYCR